MYLDKKTIVTILKQKNTFITLISTVLFIIIFLTLSFKFLLPSFENQIMKNTIDDAKRVSNHLNNVYQREQNFSHMKVMQNDLNIEKIRFFDKNGKIIYSTQDNEIGTVNKNSYYQDVVAKGDVYYKIVHKGDDSLDGRTINTDVAEIYIPIMKEGKFLYSFEVYYDITQKVQNFDSLTFNIKIMTYITLFLVLLLIVIKLYYNYTDLQIQDQLYKSEKMASLGEMIANIAHQWRQPLQAISVITQKLQITHMLNDGKVTEEEMKDMVDKVSLQLDYLTNTIETFRNYAKDDKEIIETNLLNELDSAISIIEAVIKNNNISITTNTHSDEPIFVNLIPGELSQVFVNIINNSKDAFLEKNIQNPNITINLQTTKQTAIITIEDNAGGIPENILSKIFEPYFTTKHQSQGTGLGLHMCYKIIKESLKGNIYANNTDGGAKFTIELPISE